MIKHKDTFKPMDRNDKKTDRNAFNKINSTMNNSQKKICSVCSNEIEKKYCPKCGQYFTNKKVTSITILKDIFNSVFSLEKSLFRNIKTGLIQPKKLILNYLNGYRGFYFSPGKFFTIASLFLLLHYLYAKDFLGITIEGAGGFTQVIMLFVNILFLTFFSYLLYYKYKKNFYEHLILITYNVSLWSILFTPISILLNIFIADNSIEQYFFFPYHLLIMIWTSKVFEMSKLKRVIFVSLNFILFYGVFSFLVIKYGGGFDW
ncbi:DUF3667 domain-containing protein [Polaribacter sp. Q13]|uniref:DUF3667 domain-containing protein n=1 Tax=Polaribacter sp. Q13 TaxID=2806551 RepID=UPI00193B80E6|nr:DUF3667 domain-containing protein [Polaribacter sp. Q13]QVY64632.1 DUF3667 domain-containing protein [Polaribacter sp. Q13]